MGHSEKYELVLKFYKTKMWSEKMTRDAVIKNWITESEFKEITGKDYQG